MQTNFVSSCTGSSTVGNASQPAEVEGSVEMGSDAWMALHLLDRLDVSADEEPRVQQVEEIVRRMGAALSAVTAERDAAQKDAERYRWVSSGLHEAETLASIVICHGGYAEKVAERVDVYREAAMAAKEPEPEHVCSGCGAKGWTGNCLECIPY